MAPKSSQAPPSSSPAGHLVSLSQRRCGPSVTNTPISRKPCVCACLCVCARLCVCPCVSVCARVRKAGRQRGRGKERGELGFPSRIRDPGPWGLSVCKASSFAARGQGLRRGAAGPWGAGGLDSGHSISAGQVQAPHCLGHSRDTGHPCLPFHLAPGRVPHCPLGEPAGHPPWATQDLG